MKRKRSIAFQALAKKQKTEERTPEPDTLIDGKTPLENSSILFYDENVQPYTYQMFCDHTDGWMQNVKKAEESAEDIKLDTEYELSKQKVALLTLEAEKEALKLENLRQERASREEKKELERKVQRLEGQAAEDAETIADLRHRLEQYETGTSAQEDGKNDAGAQETYETYSDDDSDGDDEEDDGYDI